MSEYSENIKISEKMADVIENCQNYVWTFLHGSVQCGKSVTAALALSLLIENSSPKDNLFLTLGYTESSAINNFWICSGFGIQSYFGSRCERGKYPGTNINCLRIKTRTGMKYVLAFGGNTKTSGNGFHGFRLSAIGIDELDRLTPEVIEEVKQRITAVDDPHIIATLNPNVPKHPVYTLIQETVDRGIGMRTDWTLDDNIALSPEKIESVKAMYDPESNYYKRYILGLSVDPESQIYTVRDYNILDKFNPEDYITYITTCDQGVSISSSVFQLNALTYNQELGQFEMHTLKEYFYLNSEHRGADIKMYKDTAYDYLVFIKECITLMGGRFPETIYIDMDEEFYRNVVEVFRNNSFPTQAVRYVIKNDVAQRLKQGSNVLYHGKARIYKGCKHLIEDLKSATYDTKKLEIGKFERAKDYTDSGHLDSLDAWEYSFTHYQNKLYIASIEE